MMQSARKTFFVIGVAFAVLLAVWEGADYGLVHFLGGRMTSQLGRVPTVLLLNAVSLYGIALPLFLLLLRKLPAQVPEKSSLPVGKWCVLLLMGYALLIAGSLLGIAVTGLLKIFTGLETHNNAAELLASGESPLILFLFTAVLAPIFEELICRKLLLDRLRMYGEKLAIVFSAVTFGVMHGNLNQFFFAALVGALFGYVYLRTGKLRYTVFMHMFVNGFSTVLTLLGKELLELPKMDIQAQMSFFENADSGVWLRLLVSWGLSALEYGFAFAGLILLIVKRQEITFPGGEARLLSRRERIKNVYLNPGVLILAAAAAAVFVLGYII